MARRRWSVHRNLQPGLVAGVVFAAGLIGIHSRVLPNLGSVWPANAFLLSILTRLPATTRLSTWILSALAYVAADLVSGSELATSLILNGGNMIAVATGVLAARLAPADTFDLGHPIKVVYVVLIMALAAAGGGLAGLVAGPLLFDLTPLESVALWWSTEYVNLAVIMPVAVMFAVSWGTPIRVFSSKPHIALRQAGALVFLVGCIFVATTVGGPGAIVMPLPALIWCAVQFRPAVSSLLAAMTCAWFLTAVPFGWMSIGFDLDGIVAASSFRVGMAMILVAQFAVAGVNAAWRRANGALAYSARHDDLTGICNRAWFMRSADHLLADLRPQETACLLMVDIDMFKAINDSYGHPAGDVVIVAVAGSLAAQARRDDVVGRLGGEEFALLLGNTTPEAARGVAERICRTVEDLQIRLPDGPTISVTVSIGARICRHMDELHPALTDADAALYAAKRAGRNRVVCASEAAAMAPSLAIEADLPYTPRIRSAGG